MEPLAEAEDFVTASPRELRLRTTSDPANLAPVRRDIENLCIECGFDDVARGEIVLCVNEAMTNIYRHAYGGKEDGPIELTAHFADGLLQITLRDWGSGKTPRPRTERDPLEPGGVGLLCLGRLMDRIAFDPQPDGMLLTLERRL
jgi:anti-sigma regulatory factor (Ser/Thr protein kinase)